MKSLCAAAWAACWLLTPTLLRAADDTIKKVGEPPIKCSISSINKDEVKYEKSGKVEIMPTYDIESIRLADEPPQLNLIRNQVNNGAFENALRTLDKLSTDSIDKAEVKAEIQYMRAYCNGKLALGGGD